MPRRNYDKRKGRHRPHGYEGAALLRLVQEYGTRPPPDVRETNDQARKQHHART